MRIFLTRSFQRFANKESIEDAVLRKAIGRADQGLIDADLGGGVIKQRIPRLNQGKSGGFRSVIVYRTGEKAFFVFGFAKSGSDNITKDELAGFRELADVLLAYSELELDTALENKILTEVTHDEQEIQE